MLVLILVQLTCKKCCIPVSGLADTIFKIQIIYNLLTAVWSKIVNKHSIRGFAGIKLGYKLCKGTYSDYCHFWLKICMKKSHMKLIISHRVVDYISNRTGFEHLPLSHKIQNDEKKFKLAPNRETQ